MKVAFIGTHGVGKTTLCFELGGALKRHGLHVDIVKEVARLSPLPINQQTSIDAQLWILMTQVAEEIRSSSHHDIVLCDRSVLDNYAYLVRAFGRHPPVEAFVSFWLRSYDRLFLVPVVARAEADGVRDVEERFVRDIDALVGDLLHEMPVPHERLDPERREHWSRDVLAQVLADPRCPRCPTGR